MAKTTAEAFAEARALDAPIAVRLAHFAKALRTLAPAFADAYDRLVERLVAGEVASSAPAVGTVMPPFLMPDEAGRLVLSGEVFADGPTVLSFNRGHWCPFCQLEISALAAEADRIAARRGRIVSITLEPAPLLRKLRDDTGAPFTFLSDIGNAYALQLGLAMHLGDDVRGLMLKGGLDLSRFHGNDNWVVPVPATFVIDPGGTVRARWVDPDFRTRAPVESVLAALGS